MSLPWIPGYAPPAADPDLIKQVTGAIEGAVNTATEVATSMGSQVAGQVGGPAAAQAVKDVGSVAQATEKIAESVVVPTIIAGTGLAPSGGSVTTSVTSVIEKAAEAAILEAQGVVVGRVQTAITNALSGLGAPAVATIPKGDLKKIDAWERAGRTFLIGLTLTVLAGLVQVVGTAVSSGSVNFFTTDGWNSVITLAVASVASSVFSYILRYLKEPAGAAIDSSTKA